MSVTSQTANPLSFPLNEQERCNSKSFGSTGSITFFFPIVWFV